MPPHKTTDADPTPKAKSMRKGGANRDIRSASPAKPADPTPSRPKATPRRRKPKTNGVKAGDDIKGGHKSHHATKETTPSIADSAADSDDVEEEAASAIAAAAASALAADTEDTAAVMAAVNGLNDDDNALKEDTARVTVTSDVTGEGDSETVRTSVRVEMPVDALEQPLPESPEAALQQAKDILVEAKELQAAEQSSSRKRKADDLEIENPEEELIEVTNTAGEGEELADGSPSPSGAPTEEHPAKRTRVMVPAEEFRRQKMQKRALLGLSATIAVGAMIPVISNLF